MSLNRAEFLSKLDPTLFMTSVLGSVEGESDPRNLVVVMDLLNFILLNFCQPGAEFGSAE
jgi:hypothetical protein